MFSAITSFITGKINTIFLIVIASLITVIGVQYLGSKRLESSIKSKDGEIAVLQSELGTANNRLVQQESDLNKCTAATKQLESAAKEQSEKAAKELDVAKKRADENLNYAKNLVKAVPTSDNDYEATVHLMNTLIDRRNSK